MIFETIVAISLALALFYYVGKIYSYTISNEGVVIKVLGFTHKVILFEDITEARIVTWKDALTMVRMKDMSNKISKQYVFLKIVIKKKRALRNFVAANGLFITPPKPADFAEELNKRLSFKPKI